MVSEAQRAAMPQPHALMVRSRGLAVLDAIANPNGDPSWRQFHHTMGRGRYEQIARWTDGMGSDYTIVWTPEGLYLRGYDNESLNRPKINPDWQRQITHAVPPIFSELTRDPKLIGSKHTPMVDDEYPAATVCMWWMSPKRGWELSMLDDGFDGAEGDGFTDLFWPLITDIVDTLAGEMFEDYYETQFPPHAAAWVLAGRPVSTALIQSMNPRVDPATVVAEALAAGHPVTDDPYDHPPLGRRTRSRLIDAVLRFDVHAVVDELDNGPVDVDEVDSGQRTALHWAVLSDNAAMTALLLRAGANVHRADQFGYTPIHLARRASPQVVAMLLQAGANLDVPSRDGRTARQMSQHRPAAIGAPNI